jgi:hypothetical protein
MDVGTRAYLMIHVSFEGREKKVQKFCGGYGKKREPAIGEGFFLR